MLKHQYRLLARSRLRQHLTYSTTLFTAKYAINQLPNSRFGFIVGKIVDKRATARNRARRVFRSCIEEELPKIVPGLDMLFFLKKDIIGKERSTVCSELEKFLIEKSFLRDAAKTQNVNLKAQNHISKRKTD